MSGGASRRGAWTTQASQALLVLAVVAGAFWVVHHALEVLRARGVRSGFDFLTEPAGFSISEGWLDFDASQPFWRAFVAGLSFYSAAFVAEIVRAGILSVSQGQVLAGQALGLTSVQQLRIVILPQALRVIVPSLTNQLLSLTKNSSLAVAVGYPELVSIANTTIGSNGRAFECIAIIMAIYLLLSLVISFGMNRYNARVALRGWR